MIHTATAVLLTAALSIGASAQDHHDDHHDDHRNDQHGPSPQQHFDNNHFVRHNDWHKGSRLAPADWNRGDRVDYHQYRLAPPPRGYEWRRVDGNYVMAAVATGIVASLVVASTVR
ncbi:MAG: RcnB family protein [Janthinobacterium lividum]